MNTRSSPSASACPFTSPEPGTTIAHFTFAAFFRPFSTAAAARRSSMRLLVQLPMKIFCDLDFRHRRARLQPHIIERLLRAASCLDGSAKLIGSGTLPVIGTTSSGLVPHVTLGAMSAASMTTRLVVDRARIGRKRAPIRHRRIPIRTLGGHRAALQIGEGHIVGRDQPRARAMFDRHVANGQPPLDAQGADRGAGIFDDMPGAARCAQHAGDVEDDVLCRHAGADLTLDADFHRFRLR